MTDMFTITRTYDRNEIIADAQRTILLGGNLRSARNFLDTTYPAWSLDTRTSIMVELMFRGKDDVFYDLLTSKLAELNEKEGVTA